MLLFLHFHKYQHATMKMVCQPFLRAPANLLFRLSNIQSLQFKEKKSVMWLEAKSLIQTWVAWTQSLSTWIVVSSSFPQIGQVGNSWILILIVIHRRMLQLHHVPQTHTTLLDQSSQSRLCLCFLHRRMRFFWKLVLTSKSIF